MPSTAPSALLPRPRLASRLGALDDDARILAVWAPAGAGKSSLLQQWAAAAARRVQVVSARRPADVHAAMQSAGADDLVLIDDVEWFADPAAHSAKDALAERLDDDADLPRIVLAGRFDSLPLSMTRWVVTTEIRGDELAFTRDEARALFASSQVDLDADQLDLVLDRTRGWAAGLVLAAVTLSRAESLAGAVAAFGGTTRGVADYFVREVLDDLSPGERDVLLSAAVTARVPIDLASAITGRPDAGTVLEELSRRNTFLVPSDAGDSYDVHPLFSAYLTAEARRRDNTRARQRHADAARWFDARGDAREALQQALLASDPDLVGDLFSAHGRELVFRGDAALVARAARELPAALRRRAESALQLLLLTPHFPDRATAAQLIAERDELRDLRTADPHRDPAGFVAAALWHAATQARDQANEIFRADVDDACRSTPGTMMFLRVSRAVIRAGEASSSEPDDVVREIAALHELAVSAQTQGYGWLRIIALDAALGLTLRRLGWSSAEPFLNELADEVDAAHGHFDSVSARIVTLHSGIAYQRCQPVRRGALAAFAAMRPAPMDIDLSQSARVILALDALAHGPGREALDELTRVLASEAGEDAANLALALPAWIDAARGDAALTERIVARAERVLGARSVEASFARFVRSPDRDTEQALRRALTSGPEPRDPTTAAHAWTRLAVVAATRGRTAQAAEDILRAIQAAELLGSARPFALFDGTGAELLRAHADHVGAFRPLALELLAAAGTDGSTPRDTVPLTPRERELVRELPVHQSIAEIAARWQVSPNTVKTQLRSVYRKLGVTDRAAAVDSARSRGLI